MSIEFYNAKAASTMIFSTAIVGLTAMGITWQVGRVSNKKFDKALQTYKDNLTTHHEHQLAMQSARLKSEETVVATRGRADVEVAKIQNETAIGVAKLLGETDIEVAKISHRKTGSEFEDRVIEFQSQVKDWMDKSEKADKAANEVANSAIEVANSAVAEISETEKSKKAA